MWLGYVSSFCFNDAFSLPFLDEHRVAQAECCTHVNLCKGKDWYKRRRATGKLKVGKIAPETLLLILRPQHQGPGLLSVGFVR